jgi:hypothetical protein
MSEVTVETDAEIYTYEQCDADPWCVLSPHPDTPDDHVDVTGHAYTTDDDDRAHYIYDSEGKPIGKAY